MDQFHFVVLGFFLFGEFVVCRFLLLSFVGVFGSKLCSAQIILPSAILLYGSVLYGLVVGGLTFLISEFFLLYYSVMNLWLAPQNPGDSLRSILHFNLPGDVAKNALILLFLSPICGHFCSQQLQDKDKMPEWITNTTLHGVLGIVGLLFFGWGISQTSRFMSILRNGT